jgi:16S rRNA (cytosine967-C5)-methyltransferase
MSERPPREPEPPPRAILRRRPTATPQRRASARNDGAAGLEVRRAAAEILMRVERDRAFADVLLGHRLLDFANSADRRLLTRIVLGAIAMRSRLDHELARVSSRPIDSLDPSVLSILRAALFQIRFLDRVPHHAAVDTAVTLTREVAGAGAAGFVNGVLRTALRTGFEIPPRGADAVGWLALAGSHPRWMVEKFIEWFGVEDAESLIAANNEPAPTVLRLNLSRGVPDELIARLEAEGFAIGARGRLPETVVLATAPPFDSPTMRDGLCHFQAEASQLVARMLAPAAGATVVDCAAAPGGKSSHLAELVGPSGTVLAIDVNFAGLKKVRDVAARLGHRRVFPIRADTGSALPLPAGRFDFVLLDAPCSGIGTLREHPEIRWRLQSKDFVRFAAIQSAMLRVAAALLRPGGVLVYSVCSFAPEEGELLVRRFLADHSELAIDREWFDPEANPAARPFVDLIDADGMMRTRPDRGGLDGFFAVRLKRIG